MTAYYADSAAADDTGNGLSHGAAKKTLAAIAAVIVGAAGGPGDTLYLAGTFANQDLAGLPNGTNWTTGAFTIAKYSSGWTITNGGMLFNGNSYIIIDDGTVDNTGHSTQNGFACTDSHHIWIKSNCAFIDGGPVVLISNAIGACTYIYFIGCPISNADGDDLDIGTDTGAYLSVANIEADHIVITSVITGCDVQTENYTDFGQAPGIVTTENVCMFKA